MTNEEVLGYHKGALATLSKERQELVRMIGIVDQFIKMHLEELKKMGIDLEEEARKLQQQEKNPSKNREDSYYQDERRIS